MALYTGDFYDIIREGSRSSAAVLAPLIVRDLDPATVLDVGCGEGWFGAALADYGVDALGVDGDYVAERQIPYASHDLEQPFGGAFGIHDVVVCLEVAEHLTLDRARSFVTDLCASARGAVVFSAAIPGQGGAGHVNEQWPAYWASYFAEHGYGCVDELRWELWGDERVEPWYQQNLLVFAPDAPVTVPRAVVHPAIYDARRG